MEIEALKVPFNGTSIFVDKIEWNRESDTRITVVLESTSERAEVTFNSDFGMRVLDELDIANFWSSSNTSILRESWLFKVKSGGWFDFESSRNDFYSRNQEETLEYIITSHQDCVSIICLEEPIVTVINSI
ncbi:MULTISPECIES: hypothetical protein [unclassified Agarivorans]|uniref:hypothetical protein n=1 Tax=unclassified Agarivorans TaxID=2636026 RepID=UPI0026E3D99C|nr:MULTISPECIES: hypothetical protein [unclassified Agarivorans]MDO6687280.1 hypothetical protein [Agarivorans sp. 3_MG-2023]MDO6716793.1 hypothetical protein [Agarivorans sp. 2_MG-2023]